MKETVQFKYTCHQCNIIRRVVTVVARESEEVVEWMKNTCIRTIALDHALQSPHCTARTLDEVMIPTTGAVKIGGPLYKESTQ